MYEAIVFLPLLGALIAGLGGKIIGHRASEAVTTAFLLISALLSAVAFFEIWGTDGIKVSLFPWIVSGDMVADWTLRVDVLTAVMLVVITWVSSLVHLYSIGYMHEDPDRSRFFAYLSLFTFAMLMLVTADNLLQLFFGWEGVGLASYLLIGFWYKKASANSAAIKAFVVNRVGDFGFLLGIFAIFHVFGTIEFDEIFARAGEFEGQTIALWGMEADILTAVCLLLFVGAMGKSAQFLLHTWLPDAMEGPTPVSALIHAATMVTAGVFLVCRMSPVFEYAPDALMVVTIVGAVTAFFAATIGIVQNDIKRVIAYSTCSQLGYMFFAAGVSAYPVAMFHLFTHAFFKALLFLGAGAVIHAMHHEQDMRKMGGIYKLMPLTYVAMLIGTFALVGLGIPGIVGFAGFYSKDAVIEVAWAAGSQVGTVAMILGLAAALLTSFYSFRLIFMTFHGKPRADEETMKHAHDAPPTMMIPLAVLSVGAIAAGFAFKDAFVGHHWDEFWHGSIFVLETNRAMELFHEAPKWVKWAPVVVTVIGFLLAYRYYIQRPDIPREMAARGGPLYAFLANKWYFDQLYDRIFVKPAMWLGKVLWKQGDGKVIDGLGPDGVSARVADVTKRVMALQSGYIYHYAFVMLVGIAALITFFLTWGA